MTSRRDPGRTSLPPYAVLRAFEAVGRLGGIRRAALALGLDHEFPTDKIGYDCAAGLFRRGVLVAGTYSKARTIRIEPALGISSGLLEEVMNRLEDTLEDIARSSRIPTSSHVANC